MILVKLIRYLSAIKKFHLGYISESREKKAVRRKRMEAGLSHVPTEKEIVLAPYYFVLSTGRCGTAYLTQFLKLSSDLDVHHAPSPRLKYTPNLVYQEGPSLEVKKLAILASRFELFENSLLRGKIYIETNNLITLFAETLASMLPNSKFIHLIRHPASFVRSGMRRGYYEAGHSYNKRLLHSSTPILSEMTKVEKISWEWNEINSRIHDFKSKYSDDRVMTVISETMFNNLDAISSIYDFIGVESPLIDPRQKKMVNELLITRINEQKSGDFPKYGDWSLQDKMSLKRVATLAPKYGYDLE
jgi:hypothetical protein